MKEMTFEDGLNILKIALNKTRGILRQPTLTLYIIHAYYEGWLERGNKWPFIVKEYNDDPLEHLAVFINSSKSNDVSFLRPGFYSIYDSYRDKPFAFRDLYYILSDIPVVWFEQPWPNNPKEQYWTIAFDELLSLIDQSSGKSSAEYSQPKELADVIRTVMAFCHIQSKPISEATKYDPFGGIGRFLSPGEPSYYQEINEDVCALARLRSLSQTYKPAATRDYICGDSTKNWAQNTDGTKSFDYVISFPPMGMRVPVTPEMRVQWPVRTISIEDYYLYKGSSSLNKGGFLIGIFSNSMLFAQGATGEQRTKLVREKRIQMVIQLPTNVLYGSAVSTCILVVSDKSTTSDEIIFLDASTFFVKEKRHNVISADKVAEQLPDPVLTQGASRFFASVPVHEVIANDCILTPSRYIKSEEQNSLIIPEGFEAVPLGDLVSESRGVQTSSPEVRFVRGRDLTADGVIEYQTFENLFPEPTPNRAGVIKDESILVLRVGYLKPTLFRPLSGCEVAITSNVMALVPKEGVDPYYLVSELRKQYVSDQVSSLSQGAIIPHLRKKDLLGIQVLMPLERSLQHQLFLNSQRLSEEQKVKELKLEEYIKRERGRLSQMMSIRRHRINPYISGLKSNVTMLLEEILAGGKLEAELEISPNYTVQDALENMEESLIQLKGLFDAFTVDTNVGVTESVDLLSFLKQYSYTHTMPDRQFELDKSLLETNEKYPHVAFNKGNLSEILDEIIHNAEKHFSPGIPGFSVMFVPRFDGKNVSLLICNNGAPVPADFDEDRSFVAGYHKDENGTGQGLFRVRQVCDEFGARIAWENDPNSLMPTGLCITFKLSIE